MDIWTIVANLISPPKPITDADIDKLKGKAESLEQQAEKIEEKRKLVERISRAQTTINKAKDFIKVSQIK
jgi:hypothetical protein